MLRGSCGGWSGAACGESVWVAAHSSAETETERHRQRDREADRGIVRAEAGELTRALARWGKTREEGDAG
eukprot:2042895-Rhodomonas_salina.3